jgi:hypothetical protein
MDPSRAASWRELLEEPAALTPRVEGLPSMMRITLSRRWAAIAGVAHATTSSLAGLSLHLLALGAPWELIEAANELLAHRSAQARAADALACAYAGRSGGAAVPPIQALQTPGELEHLVKLAIEAACVAGTVAAIEANDAEWRCVDPAVRRLLGRIAEDEGRRAELGWRIVRWAIATDAAASEEAIADAIAVLEADLEGAPPPTTTASDASLLAHGVVSEALQAGVRASAIERVLLPTLIGLGARRTWRAA